MPQGTNHGPAQSSHVLPLLISRKSEFLHDVNFAYIINGNFSMQHFETADLSTHVWVFCFCCFFMGGGGAFLSFNLFNSHFQVSNPGPGDDLVY